MMLHKSSCIGRAVISSSMIPRRFKHMLSNLPYDCEALEPVISAEIMRLQKGELLKREFGTLETLQEKLSTASTAVQGSGWGWLGYNKADKRLQIATCANQDPLEPTTGLCPLFGIDVWEHAYYLQYKNVRLDLPYDYRALEPVISAEIMRLHHQKHHATYVNNLSVAEEKCHEALQKGDVRAAITLQGALKFNVGLQIVRSFSSESGKSELGIAHSKRDLYKSVKGYNSPANRLIASLLLLNVLFYYDWYSTEKRKKTRRMQRE